MIKRKYTKHKENSGTFKKLTWNQYQDKYLDSDGNKQCHACGEWHAFQEFPNNKAMPFGKLHRCRDCHNARCREQHRKMRATCPKYRRTVKDRYYKASYGLSAEEYQERLKEQGDTCAICDVALKGKQHLDHNHATGALREFLCSNCNRGLGHFQESVETLQNAIIYLEKHNGK